MISDRNLKVLIELSKMGLGLNVYDNISGLLQNVETSEIVELARKLRIRPLAYTALLNGNIPIKEAMKLQMRAELKKISMFNLRQARALLHITKLLSAENIEIIPYKGVVLAQLAFGSLNKREFSDIDFLIKLEDLEKIETVILNDGFQRQIILNPNQYKRFQKYNIELNFDKYFQKKRLVHLEPHWLLGFKHMQLDLGFDHCHNYTSKNIIMGNHKMNILSPEILLISTIIHHVRDRCSSLKHNLDIFSIVYKFSNCLDWDLILKISTSWKILNLVLYALGLMSNLFGYVLPRKIINLIEKRISPKIMSETIELIKKGGLYKFKRHLDCLIFNLKVREFMDTRGKIIWHSLDYYFSYRLLNHLRAVYK